MKSNKLCSTTKISQAKMNSSKSNTLLKSPNLRKSQQKNQEVCQGYVMELRSGFTIQKEYYLRKKNKIHSPETAENYKNQGLLLTTYPRPLKRFKKSVESSYVEETMVPRTTHVCSENSFKEFSASLSTSNDQSVCFICENEVCEIYVEDVRENQEKDKVLLRFYKSHVPSNETGDDVDGQMAMVSLSPTKSKDLWLYALKEELSVKFQKCEKSPPDNALFLFHSSREHVRFECRSNRGVFLGVKDNHLALIKESQAENLNMENTIFKLLH